MSVLTFTDAARQFGVSRSTLYRYAKAGKLHTSRLPDGTQGINAAEMVRVFGDRYRVAGFHEPGISFASTADATPRARPDTPPARRDDIAALEAKIADLERQLAQAREREDRLLGIIESGMPAAPEKSREDR